MTDLVIVESPNKCSKIRKFLGSGYSVTASVGHIREIPHDCKTINVENNFKPTFKISNGKTKVVNQLKSSADKAKTIYIATDPDREGEAIAWHIYDVLTTKNRKKCKRIVFNEITKSAILKAIKNPRDIDNNLVEAQKARQVLDRVIGFTASPVLWRNVAPRTSAGRVQSVALKIICERQKEIDNFKPETYYHIDGIFKSKNGEIPARLQTSDKDNRLEKTQDYIDKLLNVLKDEEYSIKDVQSSVKSVEPRPPFDTQTLQSTCSTLWGWNLTKSLTLAQKLYEKSYVSYIRTDSFAISNEALEIVRSYITNKHGKEMLSRSSRVYQKKSSASSQEAHECIRPTDVNNGGGDDIIGDELKLYQLIRSRFISCQMVDAQFNIVEIYINSSNNHEFVAKGNSIKEYGWLKEYEKYYKTKDVILPLVNKDEKVDLKEIEANKKSTQPSPKYNDGSLVKYLESRGVGRPSTYASILKTLESREYVERKGKHLSPTELGMDIYEFLDSVYGDFFMDIQYTSKVEEALDKIAHGDLKFLKVVTAVWNRLQKSQKNVAANSKLPVCEKCGVGNIIERDGKWGKWYACNNYPACKTVYTQSKATDGEIKYSIKVKRT